MKNENLVLIEYIKNYTPYSWCVPITNVAFIPYISEDIFNHIDNLYRRDLTEEVGFFLNSRENLKRSYIKEAILSYFEKKYKGEQK
jgi:hypothetical protein